jgi:hypothetical protein
MWACSLPAVDFAVSNGKNTVPDFYQRLFETENGALFTRAASKGFRHLKWNNLTMPQKITASARSHYTDASQLASLRGQSPSPQMDTPALLSK